MLFSMAKSYLGDKDELFDDQRPFPGIILAQDHVVDPVGNLDMIQISWQSYN